MWQGVITSIMIKVGEWLFAKFRKPKPEKSIAQVQAEKFAKPDQSANDVIDRL